MRRIIKSLIYIYAFFCKNKGNKENNKTIFLPFFGRLGDAIMFLDILKEYKELYPSAEGYKIVLGCRKPVWEIFQITGLSEGLIFVELTREKLLSSFSYFRSRRKMIAAYNPHTILHVRENSDGENVFLHSVPASKKIIFQSFPIYYNNTIKRYFRSHTYTIEWYSDKHEDQLTAYANMIRRLGRENVKSQIPKLPVFSDAVKSLPDQYMVLSPGSSVENKNWPLERYAQVLDFIFESYGGGLAVCGGPEDGKTAEKIISLMERPVKSVNLAGKTSIKEWITTIQNADFVLCNESGSVHIAAATKTPVVCIGEQKFGDKWLPYHPEKIREDDVIPVVVRGEWLDCAFCKQRESRKSAECADCFDKTGVIKCVYDVRTKDVITAVQRIIEIK